MTYEHGLTSIPLSARTSRDLSERFRRRENPSWNLSPPRGGELGSPGAGALFSPPWLTLFSLTEIRPGLNLGGWHLFHSRETQTLLAPNSKGSTHIQKGSTHRYCYKIPTNCQWMLAQVLGSVTPLFMRSMHFANIYHTINFGST